MIKYGLKALKHYIHHRNKQLGDVNAEHELSDNNGVNAFELDI